MNSALLIRNVEIDGRAGLDCAIRDGIVTTVGVDVRLSGHDVIDAAGGALLPGLADHHLHLFAMAAHARSLDLSSCASLEVALAGKSPGRQRDGWLRAVGWDEQRHGAVDRDRLDAVAPDAPVRVQHRSGALWVINSCGLDLLGIRDGDGPSGTERDAAGRPTGRLWRADAWLSAYTSDGPPDLAAVGSRLARLGITAVTDASPGLDATAAALLRAAMAGRRLPQMVQVLGDPVPDGDVRLLTGPRKIVIADHDLPCPDDLAATIAAVHAGGRGIAVHCVSRAALALAIAALRGAGSHAGDRIEHCALADKAAVRELAELGLTVVTQPTFIARRGDDYLERHDAADHGDLWRFGSLLASGVPTVASSDAPYGNADPWQTIRAARDRVTEYGQLLGPAERVAAGITLAGMLAPLERPAGPPRRVAPGVTADLALLTVPRAAALADPQAGVVAMTVIRGEIAYLS